MDDFIRNFLIKAGMTTTLEHFNTEWYELKSRGKLPPNLIQDVPDIYLRNQELDDQVNDLQVQVEEMKDVAEKAKSTWDKFRKERDFHRMHHRRVVQEKEKLQTELRRLKKHFEFDLVCLNQGSSFILFAGATSPR